MPIDRRLRGPQVSPRSDITWTSCTTHEALAQRRPASVGETAWGRFLWTKLAPGQVAASSSAMSRSCMLLCVLEAASRECWLSGRGFRAGPSTLIYEERWPGPSRPSAPPLGPETINPSHTPSLPSKPHPQAFSPRRTPPRSPDSSQRPLQPSAWWPFVEHSLAHRATLPLRPVPRPHCSSRLLRLSLLQLAYHPAARLPAALKGSPPPLLLQTSTDPPPVWCRCEAGQRRRSRRPSVPRIRPAAQLRRPRPGRARRRPVVRLPSPHVRLVSVPRKSPANLSLLRLLGNSRPGPAPRADPRSARVPMAGPARRPPRRRPLVRASSSSRRPYARSEQEETRSGLRPINELHNPESPAGHCSSSRACGAPASPKAPSRPAVQLGSTKTTYPKSEPICIRDRRKGGLFRSSRSWILRMGKGARGPAR
ncbi:hypothetical protein PtB15_4B742 [Puccinia triticina]|nr:hypothetical protein PtB15_4B742 [Puccinia triticina]